MKFNANNVSTSGTRELSVEARVIRADGTVEELGTVAYWHRNPFKRLAWRIKQFFPGRRAGRIQRTSQELSK